MALPTFPPILRGGAGSGDQEQQCSQRGDHGDWGLERHSSTHHLHIPSLHRGEQGCFARISVIKTASLHSYYLQYLHTSCSTLGRAQNKDCVMSNISKARPADR